MGSMLVLAVVGIAALVVAALVFLLRKAPRNRGSLVGRLDELSGSNRLTAGHSVRREGQALSAALAAGLITAAVVWAAGGAYPGLFGLPYAVSAGIGAITALVVLNLWPAVRWPDDGQQVRVAELALRHPLSFGRQWVFVLPLASAVLLTLCLVLTGIYSSTDEHGLHRVLAHRSLAGWGVEDGQVVDIQFNVGLAGPFPGWFYGLPLIAVTGFFAGAVYWTLRRTALAPRPTDPDLFAVDTMLRSRRTRFVMAASSAALGFQIAGTGVITAVTLLNASTDRVPTADLNAMPETVPASPGHMLALLLVFVALAIAVAALVLLYQAVASAAQTVGAGRSAGKPVQPQGLIR